MENENPNYYAIIPANVRYDNRLPANAKLLYGELTALSHLRGYAWVSNSKLSKLYNVSTRTITTWIGLLKKFNYIWVKNIYKEGSSEIDERQIYITPIENNCYTYGNNFPYPIEKNVHTPIEKKFQDNNTYINNTVNSTLGENQSDNIQCESTSSFKEEKRKRNINKAVRTPRLGAHYGHAKFTDEEYEQLKKEFPVDYLERIKRVDEWCEMKGKTYENYLLAIKKWAEADKQQNKKPKSASEVDMTYEEKRKEKL